MTQETPLGIWPTGLRLALNFGVLLLLSWALFQGLEKPARSFFRRVFAAIEAKRRPASSSIMP